MTLPAVIAILVATVVVLLELRFLLARERGEKS